FNTLVTTKIIIKLKNNQVISRLLLALLFLSKVCLCFLKIPSFSCYLQLVQYYQSQSGLFSLGNSTTVTATKFFFQIVYFSAYFSLHLQLFIFVDGPVRSVNRLRYTLWVGRIIYEFIL